MHIDCVPGWWKPVLCKRLGESGREARHPTRGRAFLRWFRYKTAFVVWQEITARRRSRTMSATLCLFYYSLKRTDNYRRKCRGCARKRGRQGTSLSRAVRSTAVPFQRMRRRGYQHQEQPLSDRDIENLERYLLITSSLKPRGPALCHFRIRYPDPQPSNIIVSRSPDSGLHVRISLIDWQHT